VSQRLACPHCRRALTLRELTDDADWRAFVELRGALPAVVQRPLDAYLQLFRPRTRELSPGRLLRLTEQIAPVIQSARLRAGGVDYVVSAEQWAAGMVYLIDTPPQALTLPLKSHGYLARILAARAERAAAQDERETEQHRRQRPHVDSGPVALGALLERGSAPSAAPLDRSAGREAVAAARQAVRGGVRRGG